MLRRRSCDGPFAVILMPCVRGRGTQVLQALTPPCAAHEHDHAHQGGRLAQRFHERVAYGQEAQFLLGDGFLTFVTRGQTAQRALSRIPGGFAARPVMRADLADPPFQRLVVDLLMMSRLRIPLYCEKRKKS